MSHHLSLEDLLALRDRRPTSLPDAEDHVAECPRCSAELDRLRSLQSALAELDVPEPPRDLWPDVREQIERQRRSRQLTRFLAAAAALLAVALLAGLPRVIDRAPSGASEDPSLAAALISLQEQSQHLDVEMRSLGLDERVLSGWQAATIVALEDELESVDRQLQASTRSASNEELELWQQRLVLQDALFRVHIDPDGLQNL